MPKNIMTDAESEPDRLSLREEISGVIQTRRYYDEENDREFTFLTNTKQLSALDVANFYKKRWLIECSSNGSSSI